MFNQLLIASKRQVAWTWVMAGATVVNPALNAFLITVTQHRYHNGAIGAAISLFVTELLIVAVGFGMVGRGILDRRAGRRCALVAGASVAMCAVAVATRPLLGTVPSLAAGGLLFALLAAGLRLVTPEEVAFVRAQRRRIVQRLRA
jgi:O-antigen/teichoic acid export membrane protein